MKTMRYAVLKKNFRGRMSSWKRGTKVKVVSFDGKYLIKRIHKKQGELPILNMCYGVPRSALKFVK